jgi:hypothetical protein
MKNVIINLNFSKIVNKRGFGEASKSFESLIVNKLKKKKITVTKLRNTYVESKYGIANFPPKLFLAALLTLPNNSGYLWKIDELSGKYTLKFQF